MKLYFSRGACSLASRIIINELNLKCEFEAVDLASKKTESGQDFLTINPKGYVPTLITNAGETLTENAVILQYLADTEHAHELLAPTSRIHRYNVLEWLNYVSTELHKGFGPLFNPNFPQELKNSITIPFLMRRLQHVNKHLSNKTYLMGDKFTLPDAYLFVVLRWAYYFKLDFSGMPHLSRYMTLLQSRKSIEQSLEEEKLKVGA